MEKGNKRLPHAATEEKLSKRQSFPVFVSCVSFVQRCTLFSSVGIHSRHFRIQIWKVRCLICICSYFLFFFSSLFMFAASHMESNAIVYHSTTSWCAPINMYGRDIGCIGRCRHRHTMKHTTRMQLQARHNTNSKKRKRKKNTWNYWNDKQLVLSSIERSVGTSYRFAKLCE